MIRQRNRSRTVLSIARALTYSLCLAASTLFAAPGWAQVEQPVAVVATTTQNPHGELSEACSTCHSATGWKPAVVSPQFKHAPKLFPLEGAHAQAKCLACHKSLDFKDTKTQCSSCHKDVHRGELGSDCGRCHTARNFLDRSVMQQLHQTTRFPLTGAHLMADCQSCHAPVAQGHLSFVNIPTECDGCHMAAYEATALSAVPHRAAQFPTACDQCHVTVSWSNVTKFNHALTSLTCVTCHLTNYTRTTSPPHASAQFATTCEDCHKTTSTWAGALFDHATTTLACSACHMPDFQKALSPKHAAGGFPTDCLACHKGTTTWAGAVFDHLATWPDYTGAHPSVQCTKCHTTGVYVGLSTNCYSCHATEWNNAENHRGKPAPATCLGSGCHTTSTFNH